MDFGAEGIKWKGKDLIFRLKADLFQKFYRQYLKNGHGKSLNKIVFWVNFKDRMWRE